MRYSEDNLAQWYPLFSVVPILILTLRIKFATNLAIIPIANDMFGLCAKGGTDVVVVHEQCLHAVTAAQC